MVGDEIFHRRHQGGALLIGENVKELALVFVCESSQNGDEMSALPCDLDELITLVIARHTTDRKFFVAQSLDEFGDRTARHPHPFGEDAGIHGSRVMEFAQSDPFRDGHPSRFDLLCKGVADMVRDKSQPVTQVRIKFADRSSWCHGMKVSLDGFQGNYSIQFVSVNSEIELLRTPPSSAFAVNLMQKQTPRDSQIERIRGWLHIDSDQLMANG